MGYSRPPPFPHLSPCSFEAGAPLSKPALQRLMYEQITRFHPELQLQDSGGVEQPCQPQQPQQPQQCNVQAAHMSLLCQPPATRKQPPPPNPPVPPPRAAAEAAVAAQPLSTGRQQKLPPPPPLTQSLAPSRGQPQQPTHDPHPHLGGDAQLCAQFASLSSSPASSSTWPALPPREPRAAASGGAGGLLEELGGAVRWTLPGAAAAAGTHAAPWPTAGSDATARL